MEKATGAYSKKEAVEGINGFLKLNSRPYRVGDYDSILNLNTSNIPKKQTSKFRKILSKIF